MNTKEIKWTSFISIELPPDDVAGAIFDERRFISGKFRVEINSEDNTVSLNNDHGTFIAKISELTIEGTQAPTDIEALSKALYPYVAIGSTSSGGGEGGGVEKIVAGSNVTLSPTSGEGVVTINVTGGASGMTEVVHDNTLSGKGIAGDPLKVIGGGGGGAVSKIIAGSNISVDPASGVGDVTISTTGTASVVNDWFITTRPGTQVCYMANVVKGSTTTTYVLDGASFAIDHIDDSKLSDCVRDRVQNITSNDGTVQLTKNNWSQSTPGSGSKYDLSVPKALFAFENSDGQDIPQNLSSCRTYHEMRDYGRNETNVSTFEGIHRQPNFNYGSVAFPLLGVLGAYTSDTFKEAINNCSARGSSGVFKGWSSSPWSWNQIPFTVQSSEWGATQSTLMCQTDLEYEGNRFTFLIRFGPGSSTNVGNFTLPILMDSFTPDFTNYWGNGDCTLQLNLRYHIFNMILTHVILLNSGAKNIIKSHCSSYEQELEFITKSTDSSVPHRPIMIPRTVVFNEEHPNELLIFDEAADALEYDTLYVRKSLFLEPI